MLSRGSALVRLRDSDFAAAGVTRVGRVVGVRDGRPLLYGGQVLDVANVVWCTGFGQDFSWIKLPSLSRPGLHFVGLPFQSNLASALIDGVGEDAERIAQRVAQCHRSA
jgi:putative flavoprotein involved in K+ transport